MSSPNHSGPATQYARALLELATERNLAEPLAAELRDLAELLEKNPTVLSFLRDPGVSEDQRRAAIDKLAAHLSPLLLNTLRLLNSKRRLGLLPRIAEAYQDLLDEQLGKI